MKGDIGLPFYVWYARAKFALRCHGFKGKTRSHKPLKIIHIYSTITKRNVYIYL
jgi:hypothetical protein